MTGDVYEWRDPFAEVERLRYVLDERAFSARHREHELRRQHAEETHALRRQLDYTLEHALTLTHLANSPFMIVQAADLPNWPAHLPLVLPIRGSAL